MSLSADNWTIQNKVIFLNAHGKTVHNSTKYQSLFYLWIGSYTNT